MNKVFLTFSLLLFSMNLFGQLAVDVFGQKNDIQEYLESEILNLIDLKLIDTTNQFIYVQPDSIIITKKSNQFSGTQYFDNKIPFSFSNCDKVKAFYPNFLTYQSSNLNQIIEYIDQSIISKNDIVIYVLTISNDKLRFYNFNSDFNCFNLFSISIIDGNCNVVNIW